MMCSWLSEGQEWPGIAGRRAMAAREDRGGRQSADRATHVVLFAGNTREQVLILVAGHFEVEDLRKFCAEITTRNLK